MSLNSLEAYYQDRNDIIAERQAKRQAAVVAAEAEEAAEEEVIREAEQAARKEINTRTIRKAEKAAKAAQNAERAAARAAEKVAKAAQNARREAEMAVGATASVNENWNNLDAQRHARFSQTENQRRHAAEAFRAIQAERAAHAARAAEMAVGATESVIENWNDLAAQQQARFSQTANQQRQTAQAVRAIREAERAAHVARAEREATRAAEMAVGATESITAENWNHNINAYREARFGQTNAVKEALRAPRERAEKQAEEDRQFVEKFMKNAESERIQKELERQENIRLFYANVKATHNAKVARAASAAARKKAAQATWNAFKQQRERNMTRRAAYKVGR